MKKITFIILLMTVYSVFAQNQQLQKQVKIKTIQSSDIIRFHKIPGIVLATNRANLAFQLPGTVDKVFVKIGQNVEKEQVLMSLYNPNLDPAIESNLANLESNNAQIEQTKRDLANLRILRKNNSASRTAFEHKETELKNLKAKRKAIEAQITLSKANQQESLIKAPFAGTIVNVNKQVGEFVVAGTAVAVINQQDKLEIEVNIPKNLWQNLSLGMKLNGYLFDSKLEFKIMELAQTANFTSHLMKVILQLESPIKNSIGHEAVIEFPEIYHNVYSLPLETIIDDGINNPYLFVMKQDKADKIHIRPIFIEKNQIIFKADIEITSPVVIKGQSQISKGMRLQQIQ